MTLGYFLSFNKAYEIITHVKLQETLLIEENNQLRNCEGLPKESRGLKLAVFDVLHEKSGIITGASTQQTASLFLIITAASSRGNVNS
jgi:hypothetical protein